MTDDNENRELKVLERRQDLDESFPKKWGNVIFGAMATIIVAIISATVSIVEIQETQRLNAAQHEQAEASRKIANARTALEIYFENIDDLSPEIEDSVYRLALIAEISELDPVRELFFQMRAQIIEDRRESDTDLTIAEASRGLPTLQVERDYNPSEITVYIQYPNVAGCRDYAEEVERFVASIGMRAPGLEEIDVEKTPNQNEIRFYSTLQRVRMSDFPGELSDSAGVSFESKVLSGSLPAGMLEIWIGKSTCAG